MIERQQHGEVPAKHHIALRDARGQLRHEECITRRGFDGAYTIAYHLHRPHTATPLAHQHGWPLPADEANSPTQPPLRRRHFKTQALRAGSHSPLSSRVVLLRNDDVSLGVMLGSGQDDVYFANGDSDELFFVQHGAGVLRSVLGDVPYRAHDYVYVPKGVMYRWLPNQAQHDSGERGAEPRWLTLELHGGMSIPAQWRNEVGQLRMDAPYCHRDFRGAHFRGPIDEGIRECVIKRRDRFSTFEFAHSPLDVVGWDGAVYPFAFSIFDFQPRVSSVHLPPTWHGTFAARGALICSFVPRPVDFHPEAIPCPYPHSSVDVDEVLFYCDGEFTSRKGVAAGSISLHPSGIPHGPHPGAYERSIGTTHTSELAVMLDCYLPLRPTEAAVTIEDPDYHASFV
jgi:homogentisate 1,2-dioxygenase